MYLPSFSYGSYLVTKFEFDAWEVPQKYSCWPCPKNPKLVLDTRFYCGRYAVANSGPLTSSVGLETVAFITTKYGNVTDDWPDIEFMLTSASTNSDGGTNVKRAHCLTDEFYNEVIIN